MLLKKTFFYFLLHLSSIAVFGQHKSVIEASLTMESNTIVVKQKIEYFNASKDTLSEIQFMDWSNAFSSKTTPLVTRFNEDFRRAFHFSSKEERGYTKVTNIDIEEVKAVWKRKENQPDILVVPLNEPLLPNKKIKINLSYEVKIPNSKFTDYGYTKNGFKLRYWHLAPAIYTNKWQIYSHKNLNDYNAAYCDYTVHFEINKALDINSNLSVISAQKTDNTSTIALQGNAATNIKIFIEEKDPFSKTIIEETNIKSDIPTYDLTTKQMDSLLHKVYAFSTEILGKPKQETLLLDHTEYKKQPVYGFTQLPKILRPFKTTFQYEMISLKQLTRELVRQNYKTNLREEQWISDALQVYTMIKYVDTFHPNSKMAGRLHKIFGVRWLHSSQIPFNDQYYIGAKNMAARFKEQPLDTPKDSLLKFNYNISNPYKAGLGLNYLEGYFEDKNLLKKNLKKLTTENALQNISEEDFLNSVFENSNKPKDWFVEDYISNTKKLDVSIKGIKRKKDTLIVKLKNKGRPVPVKISGYKKDSLVSEQWTTTIVDTLTVKYPKSQFSSFIIDKEELLPEVRRGNNYYKSTGIFNKKLQFRILQDLENPKYHQIFFIPEFDFNTSDGLLVSSTFFNKPLIRKNFIFDIEPNYGFKSQELVGSVSTSYTHQLKQYGWYLLNTSASYRTFSFDEGLTFQQFVPSVSLTYRPQDLRSNKFQRIRLRYFSIQRERDPLRPVNTPDYNILAANYSYSNSNFTNVTAYDVEFQQADRFTKIEGIFNYRKLFLNNQQINIRAYAGAFLNNRTIDDDGDFFSFGLDRPTDYLFRYPYISREDDGGLFSQQFITAEGAFKSILDTRFANQWITTLNVESSIWNWIYAYADGGFVKNRGFDAQGLYDSGIKFNLVQDFFEIYFPVYSSIGFEPTKDDYAERIRFKITLSVNTLLGLFTREWY